MPKLFTRIVALALTFSLVQNPAYSQLGTQCSGPRALSSELFVKQALAGAGYSFIDFLLGRRHRAQEINLLVSVCGIDLKKTGGMETYVQNLHRALIANKDLIIHVFYPAQVSPQEFSDPESSGRIVFHEMKSDPRTPWIVQVVQLGYELWRSAGGLLRDEHSAGRRAAAIHVHGPTRQGLLVASSLLSIRHGIPRVITLHGEALVKGIASKLTERYAVMLLSLGAWVSAVTPELLTLYPGKHTVIGTGIDTRKWSRRAPDPEREDGFKGAYGLRKGVPLFFYPARIEPYKNQMALVDLALHLRTRGLPCQFVIMGEPQDPAYISEINRRIGELGLQDMIVILPPSSSEIIHQMLQVTYAIVMPSLSEGRSMVVLEAASMNVPTLAFDVGGLSHVIRDGITGRLVPLSTGAMEEATVELLKDPSLRNQLAEAARPFIEENYSIDGLAAQQLEYYRQANANRWSFFLHALLTVVASGLGLVVFAAGIALSVLQKALASRLRRNTLLILGNLGWGGYLGWRFLTHPQTALDYAAPLMRAGLFSPSYTSASAFTLILTLGIGIFVAMAHINESRPSQIRWEAKLAEYRDSLLSPHDRMKKMADELQQAYNRSPEEAAEMMRTIIEDGQRRGVRLLMEMIRPAGDGGGIDDEQEDLRRLVWRTAISASFGGQESIPTYLHLKRKSLGSLADGEGALPLLPWDLSAMAGLGHFLVKGWLPKDARLHVNHYLGHLPAFAEKNYTLEMRGIWPSYYWCEELTATDEFLPIRDIQFAQRRYPVTDVHTGTIRGETFAGLKNSLVTAIVNRFGFIKLAGGRPSVTGYVEKGSPLPWAFLPPKRYAYARVDLFVKDGLICFARVADTGEMLYFTRVWHKPTKRYVTSFYGKLSARELMIMKAHKADFELHPYTAEMFEEEQRAAISPEPRQNRPSGSLAERDSARPAPTITARPLQSPPPDWARGWSIRLAAEAEAIDPLGFEITGADALIAPDGNQFSVGTIVYDGQVGIRLTGVLWKFGFIPTLEGITLQATDDAPAGRPATISGFGVTELRFVPFDRPKPDFRKGRRADSSKRGFWDDVELSLSSNPSYRRNWSGLESLAASMLIGIPLIYFFLNLGFFRGSFHEDIAIKVGLASILAAAIYRWLFPFVHGFLWADGWRDFFRSGQYARTREAVYQLEKVFYKTFFITGILSSWIGWSPWVPLGLASFLVTTAHYINDWTYQWAHPNAKTLEPPLSLQALNWLYHRFYGLFNADLGLTELSLPLPFRRFTPAKAFSARQSA